MNLSGAVAATIADDQGVVTITDDDAAPEPLHRRRRRSPRPQRQLHRRAQPPSGQTVTVDYSSADGTAGAADYRRVSGTLTFDPGQTTKTIAVATASDTAR